MQLSRLTRRESDCLSPGNASIFRPAVTARRAFRMRPGRGLIRFGTRVPDIQGLICIRETASRDHTLRRRRAAAVSSGRIIMGQRDIACTDANTRA